MHAHYTRPRDIKLTFPSAPVTLTLAGVGGREGGREENE